MSSRRNIEKTALRSKRAGRKIHSPCVVTDFREMTERRQNEALRNNLSDQPDPSYLRGTVKAERNADSPDASGNVHVRILDAVKSGDIR